MQCNYSTSSISFETVIMTTVLTILSILFTVSPSVLYCDSSLDSFDKNLKKEKDSSGSSSRRRRGGGGDNSDPFNDNDDAGSTLVAELVFIMFAYPFAQSMETGYNRYPYYPQNSSDVFVCKEYEKKRMAQLSTSYHYLDQETYALEADLHSKLIPPMGPEINVTRYKDHDDSLTHLRIGINYTWYQKGGVLVKTTGKAGSLRKPS